MLQNVSRKVQLHLGERTFEKALLTHWVVQPVTTQEGRCVHVRDSRFSPSSSIAKLAWDTSLCTRSLLVFNLDLYRVLLQTTSVYRAS
jgi:hypothetical protein